MSRSVGRGVVDLVGRPIDAAVGRFRSGRTVVFLIYHRVGARTRSPVDLPVAVFREQLDALAESGRVVDLDTAARILREPALRAESAPHVVITFDDGTSDWVEVALPELAARKLPATFYVATGFVDQGTRFPDRGVPISWTGLAEMVASGFATVGSHTHTHRVLADASDDVAIAEIDRSVGLVEQHLGRACDHFAYPKAIAPSPAADVVVRRRFSTATLAGNRANLVGQCDLHRLGRHALTVADDRSTFDRKMRGGALLEGVLRAARDRRATGMMTDT